MIIKKENKTSSIEKRKDALEKSNYAIINQRKKLNSSLEHSKKDLIKVKG